MIERTGTDTDGTIVTSMTPYTLALLSVDRTPHLCSFCQERGEICYHASLQQHTQTAGPRR